MKRHLHLFSKTVVNFLRRLFGGLFLIGLGFVFGFGDGFGINIISSIKKDILKEHVYYAFWFGVALIFCLVLWLAFIIIHRRLKEKERYYQRQNWLNDLKDKGILNQEQYKKSIETILTS